MKIKKEIIERIKGNKEAIPALIVALDKKDRQLIARMVRQNKNDGPLTTIKSLTTIQSVLEIEDVNDIIDRSEVDANLN